MADEVLKFHADKPAADFIKATTSTSRDKIRYFHYGIGELVNHPTIEGLRDLWAGFKGNQLVIKHRKLNPMQSEIKIIPPYIIDHSQRQIIFKGLDHNYVIAKRDEKQQEYISVGAKAVVS